MVRVLLQTEIVSLIDYYKDRFELNEATDYLAILLASDPATGLDRPEMAVYLWFNYQKLNKSHPNHLVDLFVYTLFGKRMNEKENALWSSVEEKRKQSKQLEGGISSDYPSASDEGSR